MGLLPTGTGDWLAFETRGSVRLLAILQPFSLLTHSLLPAPRNLSAVNFTTASDCTITSIFLFNTNQTLQCLFDFLH